MVPTDVLCISPAQAVLLDVALVLPSILVGFLQGAPDAIKEPINTTFFFVLCASVGYSLAALVRGNKPAGIPIISQAAEMTIGPF
jgi:FtsH-binding integral membrane protein